MGMGTRAAVWLLAGWCLAYNLYLWGGLAVTPTVGNELRERASLQSPIAASYLFLGRTVVGAAGYAEPARQFAGRRFAAAIGATDKGDRLIVRRFLAAQSPGARLAYYGAPLLLMLSILLHATRQKQIRSLGSKV